MKKIVFNIANEFTEMPLLPYKDDGDFSAEELLEKHLIPLYNKAKAEGKILIIELDGAIGYSPTFLRVAFEGLAEQGDDVTDIVKIVSDRSKSLKEMANNYLHGESAFLRLECFDNR